MTPSVDLATVWFVLVGVLFTGYAVLDGFDLGVGTLYLLTRKDEHRRILLNAIGPVWDGNEVWLLTGGGALFTAFPVVYATVFSGFYLALVLVLVALILRAVSFEFRGKVYRSLSGVARAITRGAPKGSAGSSTAVICLPARAPADRAEVTVNSIFASFSVA